MDKAKIREFAVWARERLIAEITYKAGLLGITEKGIAPELPASTGDLKLYDIGTKTPTMVEGSVAIAQRQSLASAINKKAETLKYKDAFEYVIEEVAYTWFNRLIAVRFMEVNDYLPCRVLSSETKGKNEPDIVTDPSASGIEFFLSDTEHMSKLRDDELFCFLFKKQCSELSKVMPGLFEKENNYMELLLTLSFTDNDSVVHRLVHDIEEEDFKDQVQIVGWLYQYYNTEPKQKVFDGLKKNVKITKENIPAATQLFTPDWIVRYMVENSLGRLWAEGHGDFDKSDWKYYLDEAQQEEAVQKQLDEIRKEHSALRPEDIRCIDPCCGSGHILCYMFDVLVKIYESCGYTARDAVKSIIDNNLYGLDIDDRAAQLAYFAVMMKACEYDKRFLSRYAKKGELPPQPQVYSPKGYEEGEEVGSLLTVEEQEPMPEEQQQLTLDENYKDKLRRWNFRRLLAQKYDVVCTNPPYMGGSGMNAKLSDFVKKKYPDSKSDLFACFIGRGFELTKAYGYNCMVTMQSWMFLSSFEKMRTTILATKTITNLMHMENMVMGIAFGTAVTVFRNIRIDGFKGTYHHIKLEDIIKDEKGMEKPKEMPIRGNRFAQVSVDNFEKIPGSPVAYWVSENFVRAFENPSFFDFSISDGKNVTGNNDKFLRLIWEISSKDIGINKHWLKYLKGGEYRKWYGNIDYVIDWSLTARTHYRSDKVGRIIPEYLWYKPAISWTLITSYKPSFRYKGTDMTFDGGGLCIFLKNERDIFYYMGLFNSKVFESISYVLNPTINLLVKDIRAIPIIFCNHKKIIINKLVKENITISKTDWDSVETSWDFKKHPLI